MKKLILGIAIFLTVSLGFSRKALADDATIWWNEYTAYVTNSDGISCKEVYSSKEAHKFFDYGTEVFVREEYESEGKFYVCFTPADGNGGSYLTEGSNLTPASDYFEKVVSDGHADEMLALTDTEIHSGPGLSYPVNKVIPAGETVTIFTAYDVTPRFMSAVIYEGTKGWVLSASIDEKETSLISEVTAEQYSRIFWQDAKLYDAATNEESGITLPAGTVIKILGYRRNAHSFKDVTEDPLIELGQKKYFVSGNIGFNGSETPINVKIKVLDSKHLPVFKGYGLSERVIPNVKEGDIMEGQVVFEEYTAGGKCRTYYLQISDELFFVYTSDGIYSYIYGPDNWEKYEVRDYLIDYADLFFEYDESWNPYGSFTIEEEKEGFYDSSIAKRSLKYEIAPDDYDEAKEWVPLEKEKEETTPAKAPDPIRFHKELYIVDPANFPAYKDPTFVEKSSLNLTYDSKEKVTSEEGFWYGNGYYSTEEKRWCYDYCLKEKDLSSDEENSFFEMVELDFGKDYEALVDFECFSNYSLTNSRSFVSKGETFEVIKTDRSNTGKWYIKGYGWADMTDSEAKCKPIKNTGNESEADDTVKEAVPAQIEEAVQAQFEKSLSKTIYICFAGAILIAVAAAVCIGLIHSKDKDK